MGLVFNEADCCLGRVCVKQGLSRKHLQEYAVAREPGTASWSCIVFAERKLAVLALDELHKKVPRLAKFLRTARFMGYGGSNTSTSMDVQVKKRNANAISICMCSMWCLERLCCLCANVRLRGTHTRGKHHRRFSFICVQSA